MMQKKCFFCGSHHVVKNGFRNKTQRYLCKNCGKRFSLRNKINISKLYDDYLSKKQSIKQLSEEHKVSTRTILRKLHKKEVESLQIQTKQPVVLLMDATYRNHRFGILVFKDALSKKVLWRKFLYKKETIQDYLD